MNKLAKRMLKVVAGLVLILVVLLVAALLGINSLVKGGINTGGPELLGVKSHIEGVDIRPFRGIVQLKELVIGNPEGYTQQHPLFAVKTFYMELDMLSLFKETIVIRKILIQGPECTYGSRKGLSNMDALQAQLKAGKAGTPSKPSEPAATGKPQKEKSGKKVIIDEIVINDTRLAYSAPVTGGTFIPLSLPSITIKDIGKGKDGEVLSDALAIILDHLLKGVGSAVTGAGDLVGSTVKETGKLLDASGQATSEATKATADAVDAGVKETTKAVGSALDEVGGLFKSRKK